MNRSTLAPSLMIAFALIGLAVAFYNSYSIYNGQLLWCPPPINGCNEVAASPYANLLLIGAQLACREPTAGGSISAATDRNS